METITGRKLYSIGQPRFMAQNIYVAKDVRLRKVDKCLIYDTMDITIPNMRMDMLARINEW